ncbi:hypothetical protein HMPREF0201_01788 [Cedecea davisae DSM 4568]|uniref:Uncharacterized protein n=2 Tax=Cedecea davisae TaxID=158484 RepID=S3JXQ4_9ENTR|nr:hypothetical protein HMPREF0201_01788 [Cedecea davisae DSM 4568]
MAYPGAKWKRENRDLCKSSRIFIANCGKITPLTLCREIKELTMSTDLKFSVVTTVVVLSLIVAGALTAVLH